MSCRWDIYCKTCDACIVNCGVNHGEEHLHRVCLDAIPLLMRLARSMPDARIDLESLGVLGRTEYESSLLLGNLDGHEGHVILPKNEYGEYFGECGEGGKCPTCGGEVLCRLDRGHSGEHESYDRMVGSKEREAMRLVGGRDVRHDAPQSVRMTDAELLLEVVEQARKLLDEERGVSIALTNEVARQRTSLARELVVMEKGAVSSMLGGHDRNCDVLQPAPDGGPSQKPCNCRGRDLGELWVHEDEVET
jgi:hypothetical protein